jgi:gas vesicle protein
VKFSKIIADSGNQGGNMKKKKLDSEVDDLEEELEDQLEEKLKTVEDKLDEDLIRVEKEIKKLKPDKKTKTNG